MVKSIQTCTIFTICLAGFILASCQAPRENPLDPGASNYIPVKDTNVQVYNLYPPFKGLENIELTEPNHSLFGVTDQNGLVAWEHSPTDSLHIFVNSENYFNLNKKVFTGSQVKTLVINLNAKPDLLDHSFFSIYDNFANLVYLSFEAVIVDADGILDISDIVLSCPYYDFSDSLVLDSERQNHYGVTFDSKEIATDLTSGELNELIFHLQIRNINGDEIRHQPFSIVRVIEQQVNQTYPSEGSTVSDTIKFSWEPVSLDYSFTYNLLLYRLQGNVELINVYRDIPADTNHFSIPILPEGYYLWQIQVEDRLKNISQSRALIFRYSNNS